MSQATPKVLAAHVGIGGGQEHARTPCRVTLDEEDLREQLGAHLLRHLGIDELTVKQMHALMSDGAVGDFRTHIKPRLAQIAEWNKSK